MEGDLNDVRRLPKRLTEGLSRLSPIKVSFLPSSAQQTPNFIPSPSSPTKSIYGTIMDESHAASSSTTKLLSASQPRLPELERNPPLRHPQHHYFQTTELLPEEQHPARYRHHSLDFLEVSDSSDIEDFARCNVVNPAFEMNANKDTVNFNSSTTTGPMHEMINVNTEAASSPIERSLKLTSEGDDNQQSHTQGESIYLIPQLQSAEVPHNDSDYLEFISNGRPVSDSFQQSTLLWRNNLWSLPSSQAHPQYSLDSTLLRADPINTIETITIQAFQALRAISRDGQLTGGANSTHPKEIIPDQSHSCINPITKTNQLGQAHNINGLAISSSPLITPFPQQREHKTTLSESTSPHRTKDVSLTPKPTQSYPERQHLESPHIHTTYICTTPQEIVPIDAVLSATDFERHSPAPKSPGLTSPFQSATSLALSVRRKYAPGGERITYIAIPSTGADTTSTFHVHRKGGVPKSTTNLDFDDAAFFRELQRQYYGYLLGENALSRCWRRWASARSLRRISVSSSAGGGDRTHATAVVGSAYLAERLLLRFRHPAKGKKAYIWVQWARQFAAAGIVANTARLFAAEDSAGIAVVSAANAREEEGGKEDGIVGLTAPSEWRQEEPQRHSLEFVEGWSVGRISFAVCAVVVASLAVVLLWVFLGPDGLGGSSDVGDGDMRFKGDDGRDARIVGGLLMGGLVLGMGWGLVGVWIVISWILM